MILFWLSGEYLFLKAFCYGPNREEQRIMYGLVNCYSDARIDTVSVSQTLAITKLPRTLASSRNAVNYLV